MQEKISHILKEYWGYNQFRPLQEEIILSVLSGQDTLALLPTGGGKSICFQVPALAMDGICLVVSPLIALMKDQVEGLKRRGIKAAAIYSGMHRNEIDAVISNAVFDPQFKFLYVSPERLKTDIFQMNLPKMKVGLIAVDEAHCVSQWGYDFRPPYLEIAEIRSVCKNVPLLALTATATPEVVNDIQDKLLFKKKNAFQKSFRRENLTYYIVYEEDKYARMLRIMQRYPGTGIVYVRNRKRTKEIALLLKKHGVIADFYHAGLDAATRDRKQNEWMKGKTRVIVSTNAFGMGIDKPDVRFVIHIDIPDTLEAYFQEAGRGGRDEQPSVAIMLYDNHDLRELRQNFEVSYPPLEIIRHVYKTMMLFYKIAVGSGADTVYPFDLVSLARHCEQKPVIVHNALSFLEKTGVLFLSEDAKKPSMLHAKLDTKGFDHLYSTHPELEELMKLLLRSYSGIFTDYVKINEAELARRMEVEKEKIIDGLKQLRTLHAIDFIPGGYKSTICFLENRVEDRYLFLAPEVYRQRKAVAEKRLASVEHFIQSERVCRSQLLLSYFGEIKSESCGQCDVCLHIHDKRLKKEDAQAITKAIQEKVKVQDYTFRELVVALSEQFQEEKIEKMLRWLVDQGKVSELRIEN